MDFVTATVLTSGIAWTITYAALVYRGFKDKSFGMPLIPLALNIAWEVVFSFIYPPQDDGGMKMVIHTVWAMLDAAIVATFFLYGYKYYAQQYGISKAVFYFSAVLAFVASFLIMLLGGPFFKDLLPYFKGEMFETAKFIAYLQNLVISVSFVAMFYSRRSIEGQSFTIGWTKWLGTSMTVGLSYLFVEHPDNWYFMGVIIGTTFILDVWYMVLIYRQLQQEGINPWTRL
jgi:hypothetical protein